MIKLSGSLKTTSVLIVDDDAKNLQEISGISNIDNYKIQPFSGWASDPAVIRRPPDIIMLDIRMPETNGSEKCALPKIDKRSKEIPVIFISDLLETMDKMKTISSGSADYVTKPFQFKAVNSRIKAHIELTHSKKELRSLSPMALFGSVKAMMDMLAAVSPELFNRCARQRRYARNILRILEISETWAIEIAVMLSAIGCVSVTEYIAARKIRPDAVNENKPKIPRLETVARIIKDQFSNPIPAGKKELQDKQVIQGTRLIKLFADYEKFSSPGAAFRETIKKIKNSEYKHPAQLISAFNKILELDFPATVINEVEISELKEGMILNEDIMTQDGIKLLASRTELSSDLLDALKLSARNHHLKQTVKVSMDQRFLN